MEKIILIKYGELTTKKANRNLFINKIYDNLKLALANYNVNIISNDMILGRVTSIYREIK